MIFVESDNKLANCQTGLWSYYFDKMIFMARPFHIPCLIKIHVQHELRTQNSETDLFDLYYLKWTISMETSIYLPLGQGDTC